MATSWQPGRWGTGDGSHGLDPRTVGFARAHLGEPIGAPQPTLGQVRPSRFTERHIDSLFPSIDSALSAQQRARHSRGMSYSDYLTWRVPDQVLDAPDAVLFPTSHEQVQSAVHVCATQGITVVPVGGGTSVTGAITAPWRDAPSIVISTSRLDRIYDVDVESGIAHLGAGVTGPQLEGVLAEYGWTLGHFPQSWEQASVGGFIAARSSGQSSSGYGRIEDMLIGARIATPVGTWEVGGFPAASSGPDLRHVVLGSEGTLGVITSAHLRLRRRPVIREYAAAVLPGDFSRAVAVMRTLAQHPMRPAIVRASDQAETRALLTMSMPGGLMGSAFSGYLRVRSALPGSLIIVGWEGDRPRDVAAARSYARDVLDDAVWLGSRPGRSWERGRFHGPYLRDALMDQGYLVETFETVTRWSSIPALHDHVRSAALAALGSSSYVMAHISHSYDTGASLYFTVLAGGWSDPLECHRRWQTAKRSITDAIVSAGGAVSHHHGVGRDHRNWLPQQIGPIGIDVLRAVKASIDPRNVMNPGALT